MAQLISALLAGSAIGLVVGQWWAMPKLGPMGMVTAGALLMLAFGGLMQIYEENRPIRTQRQRLALVFASLAGVILLFPSDARRWARWEREHASVEAAGPDLAWLAAGEIGEADKLCVIGIDPRLAVPWLAAHDGHADLFELSDRAWHPAPAWSTGARLRISPMPAFRALRLERRRYELIYQRTSSRRPTHRFAEYSAEWFVRLAERTAAGGRILIDVPLAGLTA